MSDFGQIYAAFESSWRDFLDSSGSTLTSIDQEQQQRLRTSLRFLFMPELARGDHIQNDLDNVRKANPDIQLRSAQPSPVLDKYLKHINEATRDNPHTLVAYAWIMYMALFSGGRWIRKQLLSGGQPFWSPQSLSSGSAGSDRKITPEDCVSILHFEGYEDGEDLKREFCTRLSDIENLLTAQEKEEIIAEGSIIFNHTVDLVEDLHRRYGHIPPTMAAKYNLLFTKKTHFSAEFWLNFAKAPCMLYFWAVGAVQLAIFEAWTRFGKTQGTDLEEMIKAEHKLLQSAKNEAVPEKLLEIAPLPRSGIDQDSPFRSFLVILLLVVVVGKGCLILSNVVHNWRVDSRHQMVHANSI
jgi:heme oxygenase